MTLALVFPIFSYLFLSGDSLNRMEHTIDDVCSSINILNLAEITSPNLWETEGPFRRTDKIIMIDLLMRFWFELKLIIFIVFSQWLTQRLFFIYLYLNLFGNGFFLCTTLLFYHIILLRKKYYCMVKLQNNQFFSNSNILLLLFSPNNWSFFVNCKNCLDWC
jgi:hypothetical protein